MANSCIGLQTGVTSRVLATSSPAHLRSRLCVVAQETSKQVRQNDQALPAMAFLHSVNRVHRRNHLSLIPLSAVSLPLKGLMRDYVKVFGPTSLVSKRREPFANLLITSLLHPCHEGMQEARQKDPAMVLTLWVLACCHHRAGFRDRLSNG